MKLLKEKYYLLLVITVIVFFGLGYASLVYKVNAIPDYDELVYLNYVTEIKNNIFNFSLPNYFIDLPISKTNTLNNYILSIINIIVPYQYAIILLNSLYLFFLIYVLNKLFGDIFTAFFLIIFASNYYFLHMYGTYISEFSMSCLLVSITVLSFFDKESKYIKVLFIALTLFLLLRIRSLVFILGFLGILVMYLYYLKVRKEDYVNVKKTIKTYLLFILLTLPYTIFMLIIDIKFTLKNRQHAENWQDMIGISSKLELPLYHINTLTYYNPFLIQATFLITIIYLFINKKNNYKINNYLFIFGTILMVLFAFSNANSANVNVVFWLYSLLALLFTYVFIDVYKRNNYRFLMFVVLFFGMGILFYYMLFNYSNKHRYHTNRIGIYTLSEHLYKTLSNLNTDSSSIATNYRGVGPLDLKGISFNSLKNYGKKSLKFDALDYKKSSDYYIKEFKQADILILANKNFLWNNYANFINLDKYIETIYNEFNKNKKEFGFYSYKKIYYKNDKDRYIEIFIKPQAKLILPFEHINGDKWLGKKTGISFIPENASLKNKQLLVNVEIPMVKDFNPPFIAEILNDKNEYISSYTCSSHGNCEMIFDLNDKATGTIYFVTNDVFKHQKLTFEYKDWLFSPFSQKGTPDRVDNRKLTYLLKDIKLRNKSQNFLEGRLGDDWVLSDSLLKVYPKEQELIIKGMIPKEAETLLPFTFYIKSKDIDKNIIINQIGQFELLLPIVNQEQYVYIKVDKKYKLPDPDTREVSWRFMSWE